MFVDKTHDPVLSMKHLLCAARGWKTQDMETSQRLFS